jgi:hypothetical protein
MNYKFNGFNIELIFNLFKKIKKVFIIYKRPSRGFFILI